MNKLINTYAFTDSFKSSSVNKTRGSKSVAKNLIIAMAFCAEEEFHHNVQDKDIGIPNTLNSKNVFSQYSKDEPLREINHENFNDIVSGKVSGVFQHPFNKDKVIALSFADDPDSHNRIGADLNLKYSEEGNYNFSKILDKHSDFYHHSSANVNNDLIEENLSSREYENYFIFAHELAHSLEHQQMDLIDFAESLFSKNELIEMENSSDFAASIMIAQYMSKAGENNETIITFLSELSEDRFSVRPAEDQHNGKMQHPTSSSIYVAMKMLERNPELVLAMEPEQVVEVAGVVAEMAVRHDYKNDLINGILDNASISSEKDKIVDYFEEMRLLARNDPEEFTNIINALKGDLENKLSEKEHEKILAVIELLESVTVTEKGELENIVDTFILKEFNNLEEDVSITDLSGHKILGKANIENDQIFAEEVIVKLKDDNLWDAGRVAEETGQDIDRVVDLANQNHSREEDNSFSM